MSERSILCAAMTDRITVWRQNAGLSGVSEAVVYRSYPCALSRAARVRSPATAGERDLMAEDGFLLTLFLPPEVLLRTGDRAEVTREHQVFKGFVSSSIPYTSHCAAVFNVREVRPL